MLERFFPKLFLDNIYAIDFDLLKAKSIKGLILDIDNTLVPNYIKDADNAVVQWIERAKNAGLGVCIVSNASHKRVLRFNERLKIDVVHKASKPRKKGFLKAADIMKTIPSEIAVIGDQVFTDILGGNRLGMYTILVKPIDKNELFLIKPKRWLEKIILFFYKRG